MSDSKQYVDRAGIYVCMVKKPGNGWFGESSQKQTPFIRIPAIVVDNNDQKGREIVWNGWLSDKTFDRTIESLTKAFPDWDGNLETLENESFSFEGYNCEIVVESELYEGKARCQAKWLNPVGGGGKAMDKEKVSSLVSKLGRQAMAVAKATKQAQAASATAATPTPRSSYVRNVPDLTPADDDIPFN
ncbi:MAG TPA: hypothetical protein VIT91_15915 [Chthoniobacterales bacterium]